jgi:poly-gamma-glutamate capsule biosynthesis protein CapA/YwtB (metallophosphatase superfamily)
VVERPGLNVAFVGFSNILPGSFFAGPRRAGTQPATPDAIRTSVRLARRRADVVVGTFHWGVERAPREDARQLVFAAAALGAGATAVVGAHPHVLEPARRSGRSLVAYSLGNFVFGAASPATRHTGILRVKLSTRGVEGSRVAPAVIERTPPAAAPSLDVQPVQAEDVVRDRQDLDAREAGRGRVVAQSVGSHHRAGCRRGRLGELGRQAVSDAPAVHHPL